MRAVLRLGDHALDAIEITRVHLARAEQVCHQRLRAAAEQQRRELGDHRPTDVRLGDQRAVDELAPVEPVLDDASFLESRQQRGDSRLSQIALGAETGLYVQHSRFSAIPENAHDRELEVGQ